MINLTTADIGKLARLSNGDIVGPLKRMEPQGETPSWYTASGHHVWTGAGRCRCGVFYIVEVLEMPTKKLTITKDDVGRWVKLRNGWIVGPISVDRGLPVVVGIGCFSDDGSFAPGHPHECDIVAVIDPPDQEDHA